MSGQTYDAPNQQVVREDGSGPGIESGAEASPEDSGQQPEQLPESQAAEAGEVADLDLMTKADLLDYAKALGVVPANNDMTKDELREGIDAKLAEG